MGDEFGKENVRGRVGCAKTRPPCLHDDFAAKARCSFENGARRRVRVEAEHRSEPDDDRPLSADKGLKPRVADPSRFVVEKIAGDMSRHWPGWITRKDVRTHGDEVEQRRRRRDKDILPRGKPGRLDDCVESGVSCPAKQPIGERPSEAIEKRTEVGAIRGVATAPVYGRELNRDLRYVFRSRGGGCCNEERGVN